MKAKEKYKVSFDKLAAVIPAAVEVENKETTYYLYKVNTPSGLLTIKSELQYKEFIQELKRKKI